MIDIASMSAAVAVSLSVVGAVGGLLLRAFVKPVETQMLNNKEHLQDLDVRVRHLEHQSTEHTIQLDTVVKSVDRLVGKMDSFVSLIVSQQSKSKGE